LERGLGCTRRDNTLQGCFVSPLTASAKCIAWVAVNECSVSLLVTDDRHGKVKGSERRLKVCITGIK
jgi:hypothetical protein